MFRCKRSMLLSLCSLAGIASASLANAQTIFDAANDFSIASNPNGVWQYGYTTSLNSSFISDTNKQIGTQLDTWQGNIGGVLNGLYPYITHNKTNTSFTSGTVVYQPGQMIMHPGPDGEYCDLRWAAPTTGTFVLNAGFIGQDVNGTTTDVHIIDNGVSLFGDNINGYQATKSYGTTLSVKQGDIVDVAVGYGSNGTYFYDSTGVSLTFSTPSAVPEPGNIALLLSGGLTGGVWLLRRRRK